MKNRTFTCILFSLMGTVACHAADAPPTFDLPIARGSFQPTMNSLTNYQFPKWFRDAKLGIWAHWGPQAVPMMGDWYARRMYEEGTGQYEDHLARWGHPSTNGWKDIIPLWKAEKWDPDHLMALYKKAGAKYFVSMGAHCDNFFLWNSKIHKWNSVIYGPHRDVVAEWQKAAKKYDLPFGVSEHLGYTFTWFQTSHGADTNGPMKGVPYDGANPNNWDLYHAPAAADDTNGLTKNPVWQQEWYNDVTELVNNYHPDLLYSDSGVPFGNIVGMSLIADFYNDNERQHGGKMDAVYTCKQPSEGGWVHDIERGVAGGINPYPWQMDTSIGDWFYNKNWKYRPLSWVIQSLVDATSKNGNLLLNVVLRPDGTLDSEVQQMLEDLGRWTSINGEAIYGSRPWLLYGEGPARAHGEMFKEDFSYGVQDIRFTTQGKTLYAIALGWPKDGKLVIHSLAKSADGKNNRVQRIELLGHKGKLKFNQTAAGLEVFLPEGQAADVTCSLKIIGKDFAPVTGNQN